MPFNGAGAFLRVHDWTADADAAVLIRADRFDEEDDGMATALSTCITKDGQTTVTANIPMSGKKLTGLAAASVSGDAISYAQSGASLAAPTFTGTTSLAALHATGNATIDGTAAVHTTIGGWAGSAIFEVLSGNAIAVSGYDNGNGDALRARLDNTAGKLAAFYYATGNVGSITTNGSVTAYNTSSDARLKDNIVDAPDAGSIIDALRVRSWTWKANGQTEAFGFVAQEEATVAPFAVRVGDDDPEAITEQWGRDDSKLVPLLVKETQSQRARLAAAESLIADMAVRLTALEATP